MYNLTHFNPDGKSLVELAFLFENEYIAQQFAINADLLGDYTFCGEECDGVLVPHKDSSQEFGVRLQCNVCGRRRSMTYNSVFLRGKLEVRTVLLLIYCWANKFSNTFTCQQAHVTDKTVTNYFEAFRDACTFWCENHMEKIGGPGKTVEVDESLFVKRKHNVGRIAGNMDQWVFGGICREDKKRFLVHVPNRKSQTLIQEIEDHIDPNSRVYSDSFKSYNQLSSLGWDHSTVNHSRNFVDPVTGVHTQSVERMWRDAKDVKKRYNGIPRKEIDSHLHEYLWRTNNQVNDSNCFRKAIELISCCNYY